MTLCPVALTAGCKKCPIFSFCPLKSVIGDQKPGADGKSGGKSGAGKDGKPPRG